ncbi:MAG: 3-deoxy-7-phosphoheptulonate synthase [Candidatus Aminicenantales bacterium]
MDGLKLTLRKASPATIIKLDSLEIGRDFILIAGPCSVETEEQMLETAREVKRAGANILRGGAFKPRSSPYSFQGLGLKGLKILRQVREEVGLPVVSEVLDPRDVGWMAEYVDLFQVGARNMQNFSLLKEVGQTKIPVILKRGMNSTIQEWLLCAEYILTSGNPNVILCERGIRTFERYSRNTLDITAVPAVKELSHLPIIVDPSHAAGKASLVPALSLAAVAGGADGLMIEVHYRPEQALCDGEQSLPPKEFSQLARKIFKLRKFLEDSSSEAGREEERL